MSEPTPRAAQGVIHDLGYEPYRGPRRPHGQRFLVIARNVIAVAWRSRWGVKAPVILTGLATIGFAVAIFLLRHPIVGQFRHHGAPIPTPESVIYEATPVLRLLGFLLALTVGCGSVADDLKTGAFQFYFARPIRPRDYLAGKLLGLALVIGIPTFGGPVMLALFRLLFSESVAEAGSSLDVLPRAVGLGLMGVLVMAPVAAGLGALARRRRLAQALFAIYLLVVSPLLAGLAHVLRLSYLQLLSPAANLDVVARALFAVRERPHSPPVAAAAAAALVMGAAGAAIMYRRVSRAETAGLGGG